MLCNKRTPELTATVKMASSLRLEETQAALWRPSSTLKWLSNSWTIKNFTQISASNCLWQRGEWVMATSGWYLCGKNNPVWWFLFYLKFSGRIEHNTYGCSLNLQTGWEIPQSTGGHKGSLDNGQCKQKANLAPQFHKRRSRGEHNMLALC